MKNIITLHKRIIHVEITFFFEWVCFQQILKDKLLGEITFESSVFVGMA